MMKKIIVGLFISLSLLSVKYIDYLNYKNDLISKYGNEVYNSMNQEAGIHSEFESFKYYVKYNI